MESEEYLTSSEVSTFFKISRQTIWLWVKKDILPAYKIQGSRQWRFKKEEVLNLLKPKA